MLWDDILIAREKKNTAGNSSIWRLNRMFLNNQQVTEEIKREIKKIRNK